MRDLIKQLEKEALALEPDGNTRKLLRTPVIQYTEEFLDNITDLNAYNHNPDKGIGILESPIDEEGTDISKVLSLLKANVDQQGLNPASGGHLGYIPGGGIYHSSLGDYIAAITNRYAGVFFASPGAVRMENMLIRWMADLVGFPESAAGNLTSGGSIANLISIVTARDAQNISPDKVKRSAIYLSAQAHHSIAKAIKIAGLAECQLRIVPLDENHRIDPNKLNEMIDKDRSEGITPWLVIASAGTTDLGAIDPLDEIGKICRQRDLWYHIDAAYGGFFLLCDEGKQKLKGIEMADSVVMDPHKGLFLPYGSGAVIVKDKDKISSSHKYLANYMQDTVNIADELSPADLSPELTKHFRGLRMWLPLKLLGIKPFRACIEEKLLLTRYFHQEIQKIANFEVGPEPELSVATFRYVPDHGDANKFNEALTQEIHKDGRVFLSSTTINDKFILRLAVLSFRTHLSTIDLTISILKEKVEKLLKKQARIV